MKKIFFAILIFQNTFAQNTAKLSETPSKYIIHKDVYGHFAEHLGACIYNGIYVGKNSTIPNSNGVRKDIIEALKKLQIPVLRWPGGCFADTYHWKDGIGQNRPSMLNVWWGNTKEDNSFGTNEFLNMCEELGCSAYLSGNIGSGSAQELSDWVKYTVHPNASSPMAELRATNGRNTPWKVKYWGIGNEAWGCGGNMKVEYYANEYRKFATFMTDWTNSDGIYRVASGASDGDYHWTEVLMQELPKNMYDALGLHHYSVIDWSKKGSATTFSEKEYMTVIKKALEMEDLVSKHAAIMDKYDPEKTKGLAVDEWGGWYDVEPGTNPAFLFQQNTMRDAVLAGSTLNIFNNHADRVKMANLAQVVNVLQAVIITNGNSILLTPTYHVMEMYKIHQNAIMIPLNIKSDEFIIGTDTIKAINGSASVDKNQNTHISLVNADLKKSQKIEIELGKKTYKNSNGRILTSAKVQDYNSAEKPNLIAPIEFKDFKIVGSKLEVIIPAFSVVVIEMN